MSRRRHSSRRRGFNAKLAFLVLAMVLLVGGVISGTLAWLTDSTAGVNNVFTTADIGVTLVETKNLTSDGKWTAQMIPGYSYAKDPVVTVTKNSVDCYLFVKFEEKNVTGANGFKFLEYTSNLDGNGWTRGTGEGGNGVPTDVWYREVTSSTSDQSWNLLKDDTVKISEGLTKALMPDVTPELVYTAYASQLYKDAATKFTPAQAWTNASTDSST